MDTIKHTTYITKPNSTKKELGLKIANNIASELTQTTKVKVCINIPISITLCNIFS